MKPTITEADIDNLKSSKGGYGRIALARLGVKWPPVRGWKRRLLVKLEKEKKREVRTVDSTRSGESNATRTVRTESEPGHEFSGYLHTQEFWNIRDGWHEKQSLDYRITWSLHHHADQRN